MALARRGQELVEPRRQPVVDDARLAPQLCQHRRRGVDDLAPRADAATDLGCDLPKIADAVRDLGEVRHVDPQPVDRLVDGVRMRQRRLHVEQLRRLERVAETGLAREGADVPDRAEPEVRLHLAQSAPLGGQPLAAEDLGVVRRRQEGERQRLSAGVCVIPPRRAMTLSYSRVVSDFVGVVTLSV